MALSVETKRLTIEELGYVLGLGLLAVVCLFIASRAWDPVMAFHASVGAAFAALGIFLIFNGYFGRSG
ncbi:hypothetical protein J8J20_24960, partial [Mycobacterium tuberculosis]|nr:hypothetical protein [Mycobacterium tuberculosis]